MFSSTHLKAQKENVSDRMRLSNFLKNQNMIVNVVDGYIFYQNKALKEKYPPMIDLNFLKNQKIKLERNKLGYKTPPDRLHNPTFQSNFPFVTNAKSI